MENQEEILDNSNLKLDEQIDVQELISADKFIIFTILSFGLYGIWWMYKAWKFFQQKDKLDVMPAARAIFAIFFLTSLLNRINDYADEKGYHKKYYSVLLFFGYVFGNILAYLPNPFWVISFLSVVFLIPPFKALNFAKRNATDFIAREQTSLSGRQIGLVIVGVIWWGLVLLGLFMPNEFSQ